MSKVDLSKISNEEWLAIEREMAIEAYQVAIMALVDMGDSDGALNYLRPHMRMSGNAFAINMMRLFDIQGTDVEKIGQLCYLWERFYHHGMEELEQTPDKIVRAGGTKCPWQGTPKEGCMGGHEMTLNGVCEVINPDYQCRFTQMIPKGDPICSYVIERKKR
jgi:hypothetical protein